MSQHDLREALKRAASALKADGPPFALAGSYALWVHGGPEPFHDVDFVVAEEHVEEAATTLSKAGFDIRRPPEEWLFKAALAVDGPVLVDVLHRINGVPVDASLIESARVHDVLAPAIPVLSPTDVVTQKLRALHEHHCDFATLLPVVRAVREQLEWPRLREATAENPFARAFLNLSDSLEISENP